MLLTERMAAEAADEPAADADERALLLPAAAVSVSVAEEVD